MKKWIVLFLVFSFLVTTNILAAEKLSKNTKVSEPAKIEISTGGFDEEAMFGIYDESGNLVSNYSRFDNPNSQFKSFKVYDDAKDHLFTISTEEKTQTVIIFDKDGKRAKITGNLSAGVFGPQMKPELNFFGQPYVLGAFLNSGLNTINVVYIITFESKPVLRESYSFDMNSYTVKDKETVVNNSFLTNQKNESSVLVLSLFALDEMMNQKLTEMVEEMKAQNAARQQKPRK